MVITGGETASGVGLFSVLAAAPASITSVSPTSGAQGRTLNVSITGADTHFADGTSAVSFGAGITINSVSVSSATALTANITIDPSATLGARDVTVSTGTETATGVGGFVVTPRPLVSISSVSPNRGNQGQTLTIAPYGSGYELRPGRHHFQLWTGDHRQRSCCPKRHRSTYQHHHCAQCNVGLARCGRCYRH